MKNIYFSGSIQKINAERIVFDEDKVRMRVVFKVVSGFSFTNEPDFEEQTIKISTIKLDSKEADLEHSENEYQLDLEYEFKEIISSNKDEIIIALKIADKNLV